MAAKKRLAASNAVKSMSTANAAAHLLSQHPEYVQAALSAGAAAAGQKPKNFIPTALATALTAGAAAGLKAKNAGDAAAHNNIFSQHPEAAIKIGETLSKISHGLQDQQTPYPAGSHGHPQVTMIAHDISNGAHAAKDVLKTVSQGAKTATDIADAIRAIKGNNNQQKTTTGTHTTTPLHVTSTGTHSTTPSHVTSTGIHTTTPSHFTGTHTFTSSHSGSYGHPSTPSHTTTSSHSSSSGHTASSHSTSSHSSSGHSTSHSAPSHTSSSHSSSVHRSSSSSRRRLIMLI